MRAGYRYNVIADTAFLDCTVRTIDSHTRQLMQDKIEQIVDGVTKAMGAAYELRYTTGYPSASNYKEQVDQVVQASEHILGKGSARVLEQPSLSGEDFAHFLERIPGAFFWLGSRCNDGNKQHPAHHPSFDINEEVLPLGTSLFCRLIEQELYR
jgi:amidohydrolase